MCHRFDPGPVHLKNTRHWPRKTLEFLGGFCVFRLAAIRRNWPNRGHRRTPPNRRFGNGNGNRIANRSHNGRPARRARVGPVVGCAGRSHRFGLRPADRRQRRQPVQRSRQVENAKVGVPIHRQRDRAMPGQRLRLFWMHAGAGQVAEELMPQRVEVEHAAGRIDVRHAGSFQVQPQHRRRPLVPRSGP